MDGSVPSSRCIQNRAVLLRFKEAALDVVLIVGTILSQSDDHVLDAKVLEELRYFAPLDLALNFIQPVPRQVRSLRFIHQQVGYHWIQLDEQDSGGRRVDQDLNRFAMRSLDRLFHGLPSYFQLRNE